MTPRYETRGINPRALGVIGLTLVVCLILSTLATMMLYRTFSIDRQIEVGPLSPPLPRGETPFPNPQLQVYPPEELAELRRQEEGILDSYRWVDRKSGVVGIPIERAMELVVQQAKEPVLGTPGLPQGPTWSEMMQRRAEAGTEMEGRR